MSDLGERIHALVEWTAPPIDGRDIIRGGSAPATPRWVAGLVAAVLVLVVGAFTFVFGVWQPGEPMAGETTVPVSVTDPVVEDDPATSVSTVVDEEPIRELTPVRVDCTAELEAFPCAALIDGDPATEWQAPDGGVGADLSFFFAEPVTIESIGFSNLADRVRFGRNYRIRTMAIAMDDLAQVTFVELPDSNNQLHHVQTRSIRTSVVTITITGTYPGVRVDDLEPFRELALADVMFFGRSADPDATSRLPLPTDSHVCTSTPVLGESGLSEEEYDERYGSWEGRFRAWKAGEIPDTRPQYMGSSAIEVVAGFDLGSAVYVGCEMRSDDGLTFEAMYWTDGVGSLGITWQELPETGDPSVWENEWSTTEQRDGLTIIRESRDLVVSGENVVFNTVRVVDGARVVSVTSHGLSTVTLDDLATIGILLMGALPDDVP